MLILAKQIIIAYPKGYLSFDKSLNTLFSKSHSKTSEKTHKD